MIILKDSIIHTRWREQVESAPSDKQTIEKTGALRNRYVDSHIPPRSCSKLRNGFSFLYGDAAS